MTLRFRLLESFHFPPMLCAWYFIFGFGDRECFACYTSKRKEVEILDILRLLLTQKDQVLYIRGLEAWGTRSPSSVVRLVQVGLAHTLQK